MTRASNKDSIYARPHHPLADFSFDAQVASVFPDMIRRSVPAYGALTGLLGIVAAHHARAGTRLYDLGCSLGAASLSMRHHIKQPDCRIIAVDSSAAMIERCRENVAADNAPTPVEVVCADIRDLHLQDASVIIMNFTLQFITPTERLPLLKRLHDALVPGGVLLLAEKLRFDKEPDQTLQEQLHLAFKRANGYSELEISQKRAALERVLIPDSLDEHVARLQEAGFDTVVPWFQAFNFVALLAQR